MTDDALDAVASALYSGPPEDFVAARNAHAKAEADSDRAARIKALRKPSIAAWVVNVFAQERTTQLGEALQLAEELREAQADLDAATLATLGRERRALTRRLAQSAAELATSRGERITPATLEAVQQTLSAAFFDPDAAVAVASGRLVRELEPTATIDLGAVVAGGTPAAPASTPAPADEVGARRARRDAERAVRDAEKTRTDAERAHAKAEKTRTDTVRRAEELTEQVAEREAELDRARSDAKKARAAADEAEKARSARAADLSAAESAVADARKSLDDL